MLQRAQEAEHEKKTAKLDVRVGAEAKALIELAARHHGVSVNRYCREAVVGRALAEGFSVPNSVPAQPLPDADAEPLADER